jgi:23S rRNA (guanine2535-N1)-methyltransferase
MPYRFVTEREDYSDYASGKVFYNLPGHPAFPIRLASEIFQRCLELRRVPGAVRIYDPCCGGAYLLSVLAYHHWDRIGAIAASDIDPQALSIAERNLSLLSLPGLERRMREIQAMQSSYGKASHAEALASAAVLKARLVALAGRHPIRTRSFLADVFRQETVHAGLGEEKVDLVISDIPYGIQSAWQTTPGSQKIDDPLWRMLETLSGVLTEQAVVAIASPKEQRSTHAAYRQAGKIKLGKRLVTFLRLAS